MYIVAETKQLPGKLRYSGTGSYERQDLVSTTCHWSETWRLDLDVFFFICAAGTEPIQLSGPLVRLHRKWLSGRLVTCSACSTSTNASSQRRPCIFGNRRREYRWSFCRGGRQMCHSSQSSTRLALTNYTFECARVFKTSFSNTNIVTFVIDSFPV